MQATDKDRLRESLPRYLHGRGLPLNQAFHCLNPNHPDRHPSMRYDARRQAVHCFACGADYDLFDLVGLEYGLSTFPEKVERAALLVGMSLPENPLSPKQAPSQADASLQTYLQQCHERAGETDYFTRRGIGPSVIEAFGLGYDPAFTQGTGGSCWQAVILPTAQDSFTARNTDPAADARHRVRKQGESAFLGFDEALAAGSPCFVVEGEFDALSLWEVGLPGISLGSVANAGRFVRKLQEAFPISGQAPVLLLALDTDEAGKRACKDLLDSLHAAGFEAWESDITGGAKDPNEALVRDRKSFCDAISKAQKIPLQAQEEAKKAYLSHSNAAYMKDFIGGIAASVDTPALSTGFPGLDAQLDGGLYEGLYIFGAISSLGKTTLLLQIADQIAEKGQDVLIFSLEMARSELMAKSISRHTLSICLAEGIGAGAAKTARGITCGKRYPDYSPLENQVIRRAIEAYQSYGEHLFISEGVGDIGAREVREGVSRHIALTGKRPVVLVDYLQILAASNERATDKQNTDRAVLELKRISRDYKVPVLGISSFNRAGYGIAVTMESFKESGAIEYSSDVLIGLQLAGAGTADFDVNAAKQENPRKVELVLLKNRNGATGARVEYRYYPLFNAFVEQAKGQ